MLGSDAHSPSEIVRGLPDMCQRTPGLLTQK